jgi:hypothetical protein
MNGNINSNIQQIMNLKRQGKSPQAVMQMLMQQNPQLQQTLTQMKNMANGRNPRDFIMQLAKQNGADDMSLQMISQMFDNNN